MNKNRYELQWVTSHLAIGSAPMSYDELDSLREQGINAILNLCAEFCDLHQIEKEAGFEVYYMPVEDDSAPNLDEMERALAWLDEAIYLDKKVLVHCRHGIGRTGTFVTAYLLRKGLGLKMAEKKLKNTRANPSSYYQWKLLKKYGKQTGELKIREPSLESKRTVDLSVFFVEYEAIVRDIEEQQKNAIKNGLNPSECGKNHSECCYEPFSVRFIEAVYVHHQMGKMLSSQDRLDILTQAAHLGSHMKKLGTTEAADGLIHYLCPLNRDARCALYQYRPIRCRTYNLKDVSSQHASIDKMLVNISKNLFFALSGVFIHEEGISFPFVDVLSGRFVQGFFHEILRLQMQTQRER